MNEIAEKAMGGADWADPLALLSSPLALPPAPPFDITPPQRSLLVNRRHFLLRGAGWMQRVGMPVRELTNSPHKNAIYAHMTALGPAWRDFVADWWKPDKGETDVIGRNIISNYFKSNRRKFYLTQMELRHRYLSLDRAVALLVLCDLVARDWFNDDKDGEDRRKSFADAYDVPYYVGFVFDFMRIEPLIYKVGRLGSDDQVKLTGSTWPDNGPYNGIDFDAAFVDAFRTKFSDAVQFFWTDVDPHAVIKAMFFEDRAADQIFVQNFANFVADWLDRPQPGYDRVGTNFRGAFQGILYHRFLEIEGPPFMLATAPAVNAESDLPPPGGPSPNPTDAGSS